MAAAKPLPPARVLADGVNGLLVEPEQPAEMALALRRIIEDTSLAHLLGQEGRITVVRDYQLTTVVEQCLQLYRRLLATGKPDGHPERSEGSLSDERSFAARRRDKRKRIR